MAEENQEQNILEQGADLAGSVLANAFTFGAPYLRERRERQQRLRDAQSPAGRQAAATAKLEEIKVEVAQEGQQRERENHVRDVLRLGVLDKTNGQGMSRVERLYANPKYKPVLEGMGIYNPRDINWDSDADRNILTSKGYNLAFFDDAANKEKAKKVLHIFYDKDGNPNVGSVQNFVGSTDYIRAGDLNVQDLERMQANVNDLDDSYVAWAGGKKNEQDKSVFNGGPQFMKDVRAAVEQRIAGRDDAIENRKMRAALAALEKSENPQQVAAALQTLALTPAEVKKTEALTQKYNLEADKTWQNIQSDAKLNPLKQVNQYLTAWKAFQHATGQSPEATEAYANAFLATAEALDKQGELKNLNSALAAVGQPTIDLSSLEGFKKGVEGHSFGDFLTAFNKGEAPATLTAPVPEQEPKPGSPLPGVKTPQQKQDPVQPPAIETANVEDLANFATTSVADISDPNQRLAKMRPGVAGSAIDQVVDNSDIPENQRQMWKNILYWNTPEYQQAIGTVDAANPEAGQSRQTQELLALSGYFDATLADKNITDAEREKRLGIIVGLQDQRVKYLQGRGVQMNMAPNKERETAAEYAQISGLLRTGAGLDENQTAAIALDNLGEVIGPWDKLQTTLQQFIGENFEDVPIIGEGPQAATQMVMAMALMAAIERKELFGTATNQSERLSAKDFQPSAWAADPITMAKQMMVKVKSQLSKGDARIELYKDDPNYSSVLKQAREGVREAGGMFLAILLEAVPSDQRDGIREQAKSLELTEYMLPYLQPNVVPA